VSINEDQVFGIGWAWEDEDFVFNIDGNVRLSEGRERAANGIQVLLLTQRSEDIFHPSTGLDYIGIIRNSSHFTVSEQNEFAKAIIQEAILQDDRVKIISEITLNERLSVGRNKSYDVVLTLFNEEEIAIQLQVEA
jgi:hypothetical protein